VARRPNIHVIGTGGTIAGVGSSATSTTYTPGKIDASDLLLAVEGLDRIARVSAETLFSTGSEDLGPREWLVLAQRVRTLAGRPDVDGIVVTHGTDTLEEAAFFLDLISRTDKPVVMTAAMRASTALSADGPANIHQAVLAAADGRLKNSGVLVAMNGLLLPGWQVVKTSSVAVESFRAYPGGPIGRIVGERVTVFGAGGRAPPTGVFERFQEGPGDLVEVGVVYLHGGCGDTPLRLWNQTQVRGLVIAAFGAGTMPAQLAEAARKMAREGRVIVVSSRVGEVAVQTETMTLHDGGGLLACGVLNPAKSAILLSLALADRMSAENIGRLLVQIGGIANGSTGGDD